jgi:hypothetical protein
MSWIKRGLSAFLILILSCILSFILLELTLRLFNVDNPWIKTEEANILRDFQFTYDASNLYENGSPNVDYFRNEYGLRDSCDNPGEIDILTIGGSTTDQRYVPFASTFQSIIEERLTAYIDNFGCVSNAGIDGHSTWGHLFSFDHWFPLIPGLKPKFIVLHVGIGDVNFKRINSPRSGFDTNTQSGIKAFLKTFKVVNALLPIYRHLQQSFKNESLAYAGHSPNLYVDDDYVINVINDETKVLSEQNANAFRIRMQLLLKKISALGAKPICVTQPHRYVIEKDGEIYGLPDVLGEGFSGVDFDYSLRQLHDVIFELCEKNTLDLYNHRFVSAHFYDGVHTTAIGSTEIGERMADFIISRLLN